jgi:hypothetical protein
MEPLPTPVMSAFLSLNVVPDVAISWKTSKYTPVRLELYSHWAHTTLEMKKRDLVSRYGGNTGEFEALRTETTNDGFDGAPGRERLSGDLRSERTTPSYLDTTDLWL